MVHARTRRANEIRVTRTANWLFSLALLITSAIIISDDFNFIDSFSQSTTVEARTLLSSAPPDLAVAGDEDKPGCPVTPRFLKAEEIDASEPVGKIPDHVKDFDKKGIKLPRYPASKLLLVSVTSNNTYKRRVAQENTFGRIFETIFVGYEDNPVCILCEKDTHDDTCHCPPFRKKCHNDIFFDKKIGWWCATRRQVLAVKVPAVVGVRRLWTVMQVALEKWTEPELPQWLHLLDDNTFINPVSEVLLINSLDPDVPYFIGDDWGGFLGGGCGKLMSRGLLKKLIGPPVVPVVHYHWPNGTHSVNTKTQLESCLARWQGGDWCYEHGDWGLSHCVREVGVTPTDAAGPNHSGFFSQILGSCCSNNGTRFGIKEKWLGELFFRSHSVATHLEEDQMFDIFYGVTVPFYQEFHLI